MGVHILGVDILGSRRFEIRRYGTSPFFSHVGIHILLTFDSTSNIVFVVTARLRATVMLVTCSPTTVEIPGPSSSSSSL